RLLTTDPDNVDLRRRRGAAYLELGRWKEAHDDFTVVLLRKPDDAKAREGRGRACHSRGHWALAAADLAQFMKEHPGNSWVAVEYGAVLLLTDRREEYRCLCARLMERHRDTTDPHVACELVRLCTLAPDALTRWDDVVRLAELAKKLGPTEPWVLHVLGSAY